MLHSPSAAAALLRRLLPQTPFARGADSPTVGRLNEMLQEIIKTLPLTFKTERQRRELRSENVHPHLLRVVAFVSLWVFRKYGRLPEVTEVFRTEEEQRAIYPGEPLKKSVHQFWRGCDIVVRGLDPAENGRIRDAANSLFPYGKPGHQTCIYHDVGRGPHLHLQVKD